MRASVCVKYFVTFNGDQETLATKYIHLYTIQAINFKKNDIFWRSIQVYQQYLQSSS